MSKVLQYFDEQSIPKFEIGVNSSNNFEELSEDTLQNRNEISVFNLQKRNYRSVKFFNCEFFD